MPILTSVFLFQTHIHYLGYVVSKEGISMDLENIKATMEWPTLRNLNEVRSFMGLPGYYRRFIRKFLRIGYPITYL